MHMHVAHSHTQDLKGCDLLYGTLPGLLLQRLHSMQICADPASGLCFMDALDVLLLYGDGLQVADKENADANMMQSEDE